MGKDFESALQDYRKKLEELFPEALDEEPVEPEYDRPSRNNFDLSEFDDGDDVSLGTAFPRP